MFVRANALGWALDELLTSAQVNQLDLDHVDSLDGRGGGSYVLEQPLQLQPGDDTVPVPLLLVGGKSTVTGGGYGLAAKGGDGVRAGVGVYGLGSDAGNVVDPKTEGIGLRGRGSASGGSGLTGGSGVRGDGGDSVVPTSLGGAGLDGEGGDNAVGTGGYGVAAIGGDGSDAAHGGAGGRLEGKGAAPGAIVVGGPSGGDGLRAFAVGGAGRGVFGRGWGGGPGVAGEGAPGSNGGGVLGTGDGTGPGVFGVGGGAGTTAFGLVGVSQNVGSGGVWGVASAGDNVQGGLVGWGCPAGGDGGYGAVLFGSASRAALRLSPVGSPPTIPVNGDFWTDGFDVFVRVGGVTKKVAWQ